MAILIKSDLEAASSDGSPAISALIADKEDAQQLKNSIESFISGSSSELKGDAYDRVRSHMSEYLNVLESRIKTADSVMEAIKSANKKLIAYMEDEDKLDSSELESYQNKAIIAQNTIDSLNRMINNYDPDKANVSKDYLYGQLSAQEANLAKYKKMVRLLEGLEGADSSAYGELSSSAEFVTSITTTVGGMQNIKIKS